MSIELKIKQKHLALEPKIIKAEESKIEKQIEWHRKNASQNPHFNVYPLISQLWKLRRHRKENVAYESRATNLARIYLVGRAYSYAEKKRKEDKEYNFQKYVIPRITAMIKKYGNTDQQKTDDKVIIEWSKL